jgi:hypothetical protein
MLAVLKQAQLNDMNQTDYPIDLDLWRRVKDTPKSEWWKAEQKLGRKLGGVIRFGSTQ